MRDLRGPASTRRDRSGDRLGKMRWHALRQVKSLAELKALPSPFLEFPGTASAQEIERWQQAWDEIIAADGVRHRQVIHVPGRFTFTPRVRKSAPRGVPRMRAQLGRSRSAAERRMNRLILRSWMNRGACSVAEIRIGLGLPALDQLLDDQSPIQPLDLSAPADILVELPQPPKDIFDAARHIISGSPLHERWRAAQAPSAPTAPFPLLDTESDLRPYDLSDLTPDKIPGAMPSRFSFTDQHYNPRLLKPAPAPKRGPWWHWAVAVVLGLVTFETVLYLTLKR